MIPLVTIIVGALVIVLETIALQLFGITVLVPELAVVMVVYVAVKRSFSVAAVAALIFIAIADVCSGGLRGYYALGLTLTFFAAVSVAATWQIKRNMSIALLIVPAVALTDLVTLSALALFRGGHSPLSALITATPISAILTAIIALPLLWVFRHLDLIVERREAPAYRL